MSTPVYLEPFYRYQPETELHLLDCGGTIDLETGVARLRALQRELSARPPSSGVSRLLIDFRNTVWQDDTVHVELSKLTRTEILRPDNTSVRAAIVNHRWSGEISHNEHWFLSEEDALAWLRET